MSRLHLPIHDPCHANWDAMTEDGGSRRFCDSCSKHVHDLSAMTEREARAVLAEQGAKGRVCVRYRPDADGRVQFKPELVVAEVAEPSPSRWRASLAAAAVAVGLLSGCADAEPDRILAESCVYEVGPWGFEVARGEGTCPAIEAEPEPEPLVMGEIEAVIDPPVPVEPTEVEVMGEAPMIEPPEPPQPIDRPTRMGKVALPEPPELMGDVAVPTELVEPSHPAAPAAPGEPCEPAPKRPRRL